MSCKNTLRRCACLGWVLLFTAGCSSPMTVPRTTLSFTPQPPTLAATSTTPPPQPIGTATPTAISITLPTVTPSQPPPEHRIGIRLGGNRGEFFDRVTGEPFEPRGNNYILLADQVGFDGKQVFYHSTFNPGLYDRDRSEAALRQMHQDGYNVVRVFLNHCCPSGSIGNPTGWLSAMYMDNVADFLRLAHQNEIYVIITIDGVPGIKNYYTIFDMDWNENFGGTNSDVLRVGGVRANARFWLDFIKELLARNAPIEAIFSYELRNELFFESNAPPLSMNTGTVQTANGKHYDMAAGEDRQRMMDEGLVFWIDEIRESVLAADPTALVSVGFFWPQEPHPSRIGDPRWIRTRPAIWDSTADFIDLHLYPDTGLTMPQYVDNFEMVGMEEKPIIIGEFGVSKGGSPTALKAAAVLRDWQIASCEYNFDGWLLWTWDTNTGFYSGLEGGAEINRALAPVNRPDPCKP